MMMMMMRMTNRPAGKADGGERVGCDERDGAAGGGGGNTVEIGGRVTPLMQLLEHTLNLVPQPCMHCDQYWV